MFVPGAQPSDLISLYVSKWSPQGSHFEKKSFVSGWYVSQGTSLKFLEDRGQRESNPMKYGATANPVSLGEETVAVIQGQRLVLFQLEAQSTSRLHCVQYPFLT